MDSHPTRAGHRALRRGRCSLPGHTYLLTAVCLRRTPFFRNWCCASAVAAVLSEARLWRDARLECWALMPDHVHAMVTLGDEPLASLACRVKAVTSAATNRALGRTGGSVWARGYHDHALRREADIRTVARYVIANPLRAGLVESIGDYPYWNATWLEGCENIV
ncbi:MAG TPA: transposase [Luteimonas sp.]|nr:transposase [Luteimonas sp.]